MSTNCKFCPAVENFLIQRQYIEKTLRKYMAQTRVIPSTQCVHLPGVIWLGRFNTALVNNLLNIGIGECALSLTHTKL